MPRPVTSKKSVELDRSRTPLVLAAVLVVGLGLTAGAIAWGRSDSGEINVAATINNSNAEGRENGEYVQEAPTPEHAALPNGGLVAADGNSNPPPQPITEEAASSTEASDASDGVQNSESAGQPESTPETSSEASQEAPAV